MSDLGERGGVPKYWKLAEQLREQVTTGALKPGDRVPSVAEIQSWYGVSRGTVEKVHALLEKDGLIVREQGRGTFVKEPAPPAPRGALGFTGLAFTQQHRVPHPTHLIEGIQSVAEREGRHILLLSNTPNIEWAKVDGLFLCEPDAETILRRAPRGLPCVSLLMPIEGVSSVVADDFGGAREATRHLVELGHRRIAYLTTMAHVLCRSRMEGYKAALLEAGIEPEPAWTEVPDVRYTATQNNRAWGHDCMGRWLEQGWADLGCTALLAQNDEVAIGAIEALGEVGLDVPREVSVVGFDGTELCEYFSPRLTTVEVPLFEIGAAATLSLLWQIHGEKRETTVQTLPTRLKIGESTAPAAVATSRVGVEVGIA